jgi:hypothetical protein
MARFLLEEGKETKGLIEDANKWDLLDAQQDHMQTPRKVVILTANDDYMCDWCRNVAKREWSIEELLEKMPLPGECTSEICRCHLSFEIDFEQF